MPSGAADGSSVPFRAAQSGRVPFGIALVHTWYLTGRKLHALVRQPWVLAFSVIQPAIWLFLFGQPFRKVIDIPGFAFAGSYMDYLVPGLIAMNAMSSNMWAGMAMIEEIERGMLDRFLASPASRVGIMNATVVEQAVSTAVQSLILVASAWRPVRATTAGPPEWPSWSPRRAIRSTGWFRSAVPRSLPRLTGARSGSAAAACWCWCWRWCAWPSRS
jgi:hypothetical protein